VLGSPTLGTLFLVWTSFIMFVLRFFAGPIVHRITPLGLLAVSAAVAAIGLFWLSNAGSSPIVLFAAATFYGLGKTFFWPTTLGVVSEQYPRGGALMLNAIAGVGMISVGTLGNPAIGAVQDHAMATRLQATDPIVAARVVETRQGLFGESQAVNPAKRVDLAAEAAANPGNAALQQQSALVATTDQHAKQGTLGTIAILPVMMLACYVGLLLYFKAHGGYRATHLVPDTPAGGGAVPLRERWSTDSTRDHRLVLLGQHAHRLALRVGDGCEEPVTYRERRMSVQAIASRSAYPLANRPSKLHNSRHIEQRVLAQLPWQRIGRPLNRRRP